MGKKNDKLWPDGILKPRYEEFRNNKPAVSPRETVKIGNEEFDICWRSLTREQVEWSKWEGWAHVQKQMAATGVDEKYIESTQGIDALNNENELRMLCASMIDPDAWESDKVAAPAFKIENLRSKIEPTQQDFLHSKWWVWQTHKSEGELSDEQVEDLIEEAKKKSPDPRVLTAYGVGGLLISISILAEELRNCQIAKSSDTSYGDEDLNEFSPEADPQLTGLQSLYSRLSASLDEKVDDAVQPLHREIRDLRAKLGAEGV